MHRELSQNRTHIQVSVRSMWWNYLHLWLVTDRDSRCKSQF